MKRLVFLAALVALAGCTAVQRKQFADDFNRGYQAGSIAIAQAEEASGESVAANQPQAWVLPQPLNSYSPQYSKIQITNGWVGGQHYSATSDQLSPGGPTITTGYIGNKQFSSTTF
jgi:hypothetical protein